GPDGAMYVCDWRTDSGGAGRLWGDGQHGRIYRISWRGTEEELGLRLRGMDSWDKVIRQSDHDLLETLSAPNFSDRIMAQRELVKGGQGNLPELLNLARNQHAPMPARLAAIGALNSFWGPQVRVAFLELLQDANSDVIRLAADGLSLNDAPGDIEAQNALLK